MLRVNARGDRWEKQREALARMRLWHPAEMLADYRENGCYYGPHEQAQPADIPEWYTPSGWWQCYFVHREAARTWAIEELNLSGDIEKTRRKVEKMCAAEYDTCDNILHRDAEGVTPLRYMYFMAYDPVLLNRRWFDGGREARERPTFCPEAPRRIRKQ